MRFPRRTIDELATIYHLETDLRDVFVEGPTDKSFIHWYFECIKLKNPRAYEIDDIDVPSELLSASDLKDGNRGRVIALAFALEKLLASAASQFCCIADRDLDEHLGIRYSCDPLLFSDYTSIEMYVCTPAAIDKFIRLYCRKTSIDHDDVLPGIVNVSKQLFRIRLALKKLALPCKWVKLDRSLIYSSGELSLDVEDFFGRLLSSGGLHSERRNIVEASTELKASLTGDDRQLMHGHDFVQAFAYYFRKRFGDNVLFSEKVVARSLMLCADERYLSSEPLFQNLVARVTA